MIKALIDWLLKGLMNRDVSKEIALLGYSKYPRN